MYVFSTAEKTTPSQTVGTAPSQTVGTAPVSSSSTQPTNNPPNDGTIITTFIVVVVLLIILVLIVAGVVIVMVLFRAKERRQQRQLATQNEDIEMKLKQERNTEEEASSITNQPLYAEIQTKESPNIPSHMEYLNQNSTVTGDYNEIELQADSNHAFPTKPPRHVNHSDPMCDEKQPSPMYQDIEKHCDPTSNTNVVPVTTSSHTVDPESGIYETVYSEPIQPSLFADAVETPSD